MKQEIAESGARRALKRIRERKLVQWGVTYLAGAWLMLQVLHTFGSLYAWPAAVLRAIPVVLGAGFFMALVLAWYHGERGDQRVTGTELGILALLLFLAGAGAVAVGARAGEDGTRSAAAGSGSVEAAPVELASIAVLPFQNVSSDPEQEYFSDGLTEEIQNALAQIPGLRVAARTSSFVFKDKDVPIDSIGRALRVAHVVEGSIRKSGKRVRISASLVEVASGYQRWSRTYEREVSDIFAMQDEISREVAQQLRLDLAGAAPLVRRETADAEAHELVLRGLADYRRLSRDSRVTAESHFREAIRRDPTYARPHAMLALVLAWRAYWRHVPRERYADAIAAADRALELDPELAIAHVIRGELANLYEWDFEKADAHFRRAIELTPGDASARGSRAWLLMRLGRADEALAEALHGVRLDPLSAPAHNTLGLISFHAGRSERAVSAYEMATALAPDYPAAPANLAVLHAVAGRHAEAVRQAERVAALEPGTPHALATLGYVYARAGRRREAEAQLGALLQLPTPSPFRIATVYLALGDRDRALDFIEKAVDDRDDHANWLAVTPMFHELRADPRYLRALRRAGLG